MLELARAQRPDLVVLDLMLPQLDGLDRCRVLRDELGAVPVIMLTARTTEADKLAGLETGADDYVTSREGLVERAFGFDFDGLERTVDAHIANLRKKIEPISSRTIYVLTVPRVGCQLASQPVEEVQPDDVRVL